MMRDVPDRAVKLATSRWLTENVAQAFEVPGKARELGADALKGSKLVIVEVTSTGVRAVGQIGGKTGQFVLRRLGMQNPVVLRQEAFEQSRETVGVAVREVVRYAELTKNDDLLIDFGMVCVALFSTEPDTGMGVPKSFFGYSTDYAHMLRESGLVHDKIDWVTERMNERAAAAGDSLQPLDESMPVLPPQPKP